MATVISLSSHGSFIIHILATLAGTSLHIAAPDVSTDRKQTSGFSGFVQVGSDGISGNEHNV